MIWKNITKFTQKKILIRKEKGFIEIGYKYFNLNF